MVNAALPASTGARWDSAMTDYAACGTCRVIHVSATEVEIAINSECIVHMPRSAFTLDDDERSDR
jgi:hypothetical protein